MYVVALSRYFCRVKHFNCSVSKLIADLATLEMPNSVIIIVIVSILIPQSMACTYRKKQLILRKTSHERKPTRQNSHSGYCS